MAHQDIRFCTTADGVRIAVATMGSGPPLVYVTGFPGHIELELETEFAARFLSELSFGHTLIRYDMRGSGLSDRFATDFSFRGFQLDLEAVVDYLDLESFALISLGDLAGPIAISYSASHSSRVTHLVLSSAYLRGNDLATKDRQAVLAEFVANFGWPIFDLVDTPEVDADTHRAVRQIQQEGATHEVQSIVLKTMYEADVTAAASAITAPTLVLHARDDPLVPFSAGRELAIRIPGARFVGYPSSSAAPWVNSKFLLGEMRAFLAPGLAGRPEAPRGDGLSSREMEVLALLARGRTSREIAEVLVLSPRTVERHISNIYAKADVHSRAEATAYALLAGLADAPVGNARHAIGRKLQRSTDATAGAGGLPLPRTEDRPRRSGI
jgi:pimeloyl-ACP methyl ester carboxylesterase/DNA-binding CsgD family transcriptional regulator